ncbi:MAG: 3-phosphoserine/phosphohydroxythreonine transaminase [Pseudomonadota bacterium]
MTRVMNFNPGPACMPLEVLQEVQKEFLDFAGTGKSILESSHRSPEYDKVHTGAQELLKELLGLGDDYQVLFLGGGASTQFAMVPMNFLGKGQVADYLVTGSWSKKAVKEAKIFGQVNIAATTEKDGKFTRIPKPEECQFSENAAYVHLTSNNTIFGTQWKNFPEVKTPLIADMSSDILWRPFDAKKFALIYAGAQKNLGPSGVTVVVVRRDLVGKAAKDIPSMFSYPIQAEKNSLYNTPPCFSIYMVGKTLQWLKNKGGLAVMEKENRAKGDLLYKTIDNHADFFRAPVEKESRSYMNIVFRLPDENLEKRFIDEGKNAGMIGLKGHRSVGGIRVSTYNAVSLEWVQAITDFMQDFIKRNG